MYIFYDCTFAGVRHFFVIICFLLLIVQISANQVLFQLWKSNQTKIAATQCVNRFKPRACCKGKCVLKKELQKLNGNDNQQEKGSSVRFQLQQSEYIIQANYHIPSKILCSTKTVIQIAYINFYQFNYIRPIIHPPAFFVV